MAVDLSEARRTKVWLLYLKHTRGDRGRLCLNILREVCAFLHPSNLLAHITESYIRFFDFQRGDWKHPAPLNPHIQANYVSRWVVMEGGSVFICGGQGLSTAYVVGLEGCMEQGRMCRARSAHGVLYSNHTVYVFGGFNREWLNSCEKYQLQQRMWTLLPSMQTPTYYFNPCLFNRSIYLCGRWSSLLEAFSPQTDQMLPFQFSMPECEYSCCCMYVEDNLLVVHLDEHILKYRAGTSAGQQKQHAGKGYGTKLAASSEYTPQMVSMDNGVVGAAIA